MSRDFGVIRQITDSSNETITVVTGRIHSDTSRDKTEFGASRFILNWYLSQRSIRYSPSALSERGYTIMASLVGTAPLLTPNDHQRFLEARVGVDPLLTPDNQRGFLYDSGKLLDLQRSIYRSVVSRDVLLVSNFSVYRKGDTLYYVKDGCTPDDIDASFYVHFVPADPDDIPARHRPYGFESHNFDFLRRGLMFDEKCMTEFTLVQYDTVHIETGQIGHDSPGLADMYAQVYGAVTAGEPVIRSRFDVYFDGRNLTYIKDSCGIHDIEPRFFLHVLPAFAGDLPGERRQHGFENRDFDFKEFGGLMFQGKCLVAIPVPQYDIAQISTGQTSSYEGIIWSGQARIGGFPPTRE